MQVFGSQTQMLLILHPKSHDRVVDPSLLQAAFNLTRAEANVAKQIFEGLEPTEIALKNRISISTVRTHLATVFEKTGLTRQTELALRIADLVSN